MTDYSKCLEAPCLMIYSRSCFAGLIHHTILYIIDRTIQEAETEEISQ